MHSFDLSAPKMRDGFEDYLDIVMALCESAGAKSGTAHMTVDEKVVVAGRSQRRPGPHVDGVFMPDKFHPVRNAMGSWGGGGRWNHYCKANALGEKTNQLTFDLQNFFRRMYSNESTQQEEQ